VAGCDGQVAGLPNATLDRFFHRFEGQNQFRRHVGVTYVAIEGGEIRGFVTVSPSEIDLRAGQTQGISQSRLQFALSLTRRTATTSGCSGVVGDAKPEAREFYLAYCFEPLSLVEGTLLDRPEPTPTPLPLSAIPPRRDR
jgi:hypothetical protein